MNLKPPLPKEHGAWAMLIVPLLLGLIVAPAWHWRALVLLVAAFGFFLVHYPLATLVKIRRRATANRAYLWRRAAIYGGITVLSGGWLVLVQGLWWLILSESGAPARRLSSSVKLAILGQSWTSPCQPPRSINTP